MFLLFATLFGISFVLFIVLIGEIEIEIFFIYDVDGTQFKGKKIK